MLPATQNTEYVENLKNKLGLASKTTTLERIKEELERLQSKSKMTQEAIGLTKQDYLNFGVDPSEYCS